MERALDPQRFFHSPHGRYLATEGLLYWCHGPRLWGITAWGALTERTATSLSSWIDAEHEVPHPSYVTLVDLQRVTGVDPDAFARWQAWYRGNRERQRVRVERAAIVRPAVGIAAVLVAGLPAVLGPSVPWVVTDDLSAALEALEVEDPTRVAAELDAARAEAAQHGVLESAREALARDPRSSLDGLAQRLGVSRRSLQRAFQAAGTTHARETQAARVQLAQRLMLSGESKLAAVALEAGFATQAQMSTAFRTLLGEPPSTWGARHGLRTSRSR